MPKPRSTKRDIDRAKRERAEAKREKRHQPDQPEAADGTDAPRTAPMPEQDVLAALDVLHVRFDAGELDFDEYAEQKAGLLSQLAGEAS
jgi:hypothetical protein